MAPLALLGLLCGLCLVEGSPISGERLNVTFLSLSPFVRVRDENDLKTYEGFLIDIWEEIAGEHGFEYDYYRTTDDDYGSQIENSTDWTGVIGEVHSGRAQIGLAPLTVTHARKKAVDFTDSFMQTGLGAMMRRPRAAPDWFQFLNPFTSFLWCGIVGALLVTSLSLFLLDVLQRFLSKKLPKSPKAEDPVISKESHFATSNDQRFYADLPESFWFATGSFLQQGTEVIPKTSAARFLSAAWWGFCLIVVSSYTANLAAWLTVTNIKSPVSSILELVMQRDMSFGCQNGSFSCDFFRSSEAIEFQQSWNFMGRKGFLYENIDEGKERVLAENFAALNDEILLKYHTTLDCDLMLVGTPITQDLLAIAVSKERPSLKKLISRSILKLSGDGKIKEFERKWWPTENCGKKNQAQNKRLDLENVIGVFIVWASIVGLSFVLIIIQFQWRKLRIQLSRPSGGGTTVVVPISHPELRKEEAWIDRA